MLEATIKKGFIVYIFLSIFEFALTYSSGSLLKLYGFVLMGGWGILLLRRRLILKRYLINLILFYLWMALSLIWSPQGNMDVYYVMAMGNMIVLVLISSTLNWYEEDILQLLKAFQLGALFFSVLIIVGGNHYYEGSLRYTIILFGSKMDPNNIAGLLIPGILISFNYLLQAEKLLISFTTFVVTVFAFVSTGSRGGMVALLLGLILLLFRNTPLKRTSRTWKSIKRIIGVAVLTFLIYSVIQSRIEKQIMERYNPTSALSDRGSNRLDLWERGFELFKEKPLVGIGIGGYESITEKGLHNQFLIVLVEGGIIGFSLFLVALFEIVRVTLSKHLRLPFVILLTIFVVIFFLDAYNKKFFWNGILLTVIMIKACPFYQSTISES